MTPSDVYDVIITSSICYQIMKNYCSKQHNIIILCIIHLDMNEDYYKRYNLLSDIKFTDIPL